MGEALISGAGGGTGKIYRWKRYEINEKTVYVWDKWSVLTTTTYKWNKYNCSYSEQWEYENNVSWPKNIYITVWDGVVLNTSTLLYEPRYSGSPITEGTNALEEYCTINSGKESYYYYIIRTSEDTSNWYYRTKYWHIVFSKGSTSYGTVSSTNSSAYPSNGKSGLYWYESAGSTTSTSKGSTSYGQVESESSSAYPNGGAQGGYWYENRISRVDQSIGSYKDTVYSTARNTYPDNGIQGGYWYVFEEV